MGPYSVWHTILDIVGNSKKTRIEFLSLEISQSKIILRYSRNTESFLKAYILNKNVMKGQGFSTENPKLKNDVLLLCSAGLRQNLLGHMRTSLNLE